MIETETLIVGAGLTGLALADALAAAGRDFQVIEARGRVGGRAWSPEAGGARYDLGPAWFWPGQPLTAALAARLELRVFEQFSEGRLVFEDAAGAIRRDVDIAPMAGSLRIDGGMGALAEALARGVSGSIRLAARLTRIRAEEDALIAEIGTEAGGETVRAGRVVLALPPRLAARTIRFDPAFDLSDLVAAPTWMAGQAKLVAVYDRPFWRSRGLSGDAISHRGPLAEIHDASALGREDGALFGFVGTPPDARADAETLKRAAVEQLERLFGPDAGAPVAVLAKDWARDAETATGDDRAPLAAHPVFGPIAQPAGSWAERLLLASAETAPAHGGYLEGALEAANALAAKLTRALPPR